MSLGIAKAISRALQSDVSPARHCRPAGDFKIYSILRGTSQPHNDAKLAATLTSHSVHQWKPSDAYCFELACIPIVSGTFVHNSGLSLGSYQILEDVLRQMTIPAAVVSSFLDNRIQFIVWPPTDNEGPINLLNFRQWCVAWRSNARTQSSKGVLLWMGGSWASIGIAEWVPVFLRDICDSWLSHKSPGLLAFMLCARNVAESLAVLDQETFVTERRLRQVIVDGQLKGDDELAKMSASHSWLAARAIRERHRMSTALAYLDYTSTAGFVASQQSRARDVEALRLLANSLVTQASKLCDESNMHLSTIYNLIAQKDQATNLAIAAASREIAIQSKIDQTNSLEVAQASKEIAEKAKKDSNAMRMIAFVTMFYLPGTFVATCFSMGVFQWSAAAADVVSPRIWVYFVFTGVLTLLTFGGFLAWMWWQERRLRDAVPEAQTTVNSSDAAKSPTEFRNTSTKTIEKASRGVLAHPPDPRSEPTRPTRRYIDIDRLYRESNLPFERAVSMSPQVSLNVPSTHFGRTASPFRGHHPAAKTTDEYVSLTDTSAQAQRPSRLKVYYHADEQSHACRSLDPFAVKSRSRSRSPYRGRSFDTDFTFPYNLTTNYVNQDRFRRRRKSRSRSEDKDFHSRSSEPIKIYDESLQEYKHSDTRNHMELKVDPEDEASASAVAYADRRYEDLQDFGFLSTRLCTPEGEYTGGRAAPALKNSTTIVKTNPNSGSSSDTDGRHDSYDWDAEAAKDSHEPLPPENPIVRMLNSQLAAGVDSAALLTRLSMWKPEETGESFEVFQKRVPEPLPGESSEAFSERTAADQS